MSDQATFDFSLIKAIHCGGWLQMKRHGRWLAFEGNLVEMENGLKNTFRFKKPSPQIQPYSIEKVKGGFKIETKGFAATIGLSNDRKIFLLERGSEQELAECFLTYKGIISSGHQLGVPMNLVKKMDEKLDFTLEGFASPFNVRLSMFKNISFCSLFPQVDKVYGSIGSFYETELDGHVSLVNPPFTLPMLEKTTKYLLDQFEKADKMVVVYVVPYSWDSSYHLDIENCKYLVEKVILKRHEYFYEYAETDTVLTSRIRSTFFLLSKGMELDIEFEKIVCDFYNTKNIAHMPEFLGDDKGK